MAELPVESLVNNYLRKVLAKSGYYGLITKRSNKGLLFEIYVRDMGSVLGKSGFRIRRLQRDMSRVFQIQHFLLSVKKYPPKGLDATSQTYYLHEKFEQEDSCNVSNVISLAGHCFQTLSFMMKSGAVGCEILIQASEGLYVFKAGQPFSENSEIHWTESIVELQLFSFFMDIRIQRPRISAETNDWNTFGTEWDRESLTLEFYADN